MATRANYPEAKELSTRPIPPPPDAQERRFWREAACSLMNNKGELYGPLESVIERMQRAGWVGQTIRGPGGLISVSLTRRGATRVRQLKRTARELDAAGNIETPRVEWLMLLGFVLTAR